MQFKGVNLMSSFFKLITILISLTVISLVYATDRDTDTAVFDVDASGEVDALTDGLLILRSMFGLSDDALVTGVVSPSCTDCEATKIEQYIQSVQELSLIHI